MLTFNRFRRRVLIERSHGNLHVRIAAENQRSAYVFGIGCFICGGIFLIWIFARALWRSGLSGDDWLLSMIAVVAASVYLVFLRRMIWEGFGVDEIMVHGGMLHWTAKAWWFRQELELPTSEISEVKAVTRWWNRQGSHVEFTSGKRRYMVGDGLMLDETVELAQALKHAIGSD